MDVMFPSPSSQTSHFFLSLIFGVSYAFYLFHLFENERFFEMLSPLEREMSFRTEQGLFYSYYKNVVDGGLENFFNQTWTRLVHNKETEYPSVINTLQRMNIYPEILLGVGHGIFTHPTLGNQAHWQSCYSVRRRDDTKVETCSGPANPAYFYVGSIFFLQAIGCIALFFLCLRVAGGNIWGSVFGQIMLYFNLYQVTRAQWAPPLREHFAMPFFHTTILCITNIISVKERSHHDWGNRNQAMLFFSTLLFVLPWQFAPFALCVPAGSLYAMHLSGFLAAPTLQKIFVPQLLAMVVASILQFGNQMLVTSWFNTFVLSALLQMGLIPRKSPTIRVTAVLALITIIKASCLLFLKALDDSHIFSILKSKVFSSDLDWHAAIYICSPEFDFMGLNDLKDLTVTLLLPLAVFFVCLVFTTAVMAHVEAPIIFLAIVGICFSGAAIVIMRLKVFMNPLLVVLACGISNRRLMQRLTVALGLGQKVSVWYHRATLVFILGLSAVRGLENINLQLARVGEYENFELEQLFETINDKAPLDSAFAGPMPLMANLKLSTGRNIVIHPHYEDRNLRARVKSLYRMIAVFDDEVLHKSFSALGVDFVVLDNVWCSRQRRPGCSLQEMYIADARQQGEENKLYMMPGPSNKKTFCERWMQGTKSEINSALFGRVWRNRRYGVLYVRKVEKDETPIKNKCISSEQGASN
eukprot:UC4_evm2s893